MHIAHASWLSQDISTAYVHMRQLKLLDYTGNTDLIPSALAPPLQTIRRGLGDTRVRRSRLNVKVRRSTGQTKVHNM